MTIEAFYTLVGGSFEATKARFLSGERVLRFVKRFPADPSFSLLKTALEEGNTEEAFRAAHTLKGVAQNLGFDLLYESASAVTEVLRGGSLQVDGLLAELEKRYSTAVNAIAEIDSI